MENRISNDDMLKIKFVEYVRSIITALTWRGLKGTEDQTICDGCVVTTWSHPLVHIEIWSAFPPYDDQEPSYLIAYIGLHCDPDLNGIYTLSFRWDEKYGDLMEEGEECERIPLEKLHKKNIQISNSFEILDEFLLKKGM